MDLVRLWKKRRTFDIYVPQNKISLRLNPFNIDNWISSLEEKIPTKICVIRDFDDFNGEEQDRVIEHFQKNYNKILVCTESISSLEPLGWGDYPKDYDRVIWVNESRPVPENSKKEMYWPSYWYATIQFNSKINIKTLHNKNKIYPCSLRIKNQRQWKDKLLKKLNELSLLEKIKLAISHENPYVKGSPFLFESENKNFNPNLPSLEQCQSFSIIMSETNNITLTEKTWQVFWHDVPIFFHAGPAIEKLKQYGLEIEFEGMEINYSQTDVTDQLVQVLQKTIENIEEIYHINRKRCQHNFKVISDISQINKIFEPIFLNKL